MENYNVMYYTVDSTDKGAGMTDQDFVVPLPAYDYDFVTLQTFVCNKSWFTVDSPYNTFLVNGLLVTVEPQNYDRDSFALEIKTKLDLLGLGVWTMTSDFDKGFYELTTTHGGAVTFDFGVDKVLSRIFGFDQTTTFVGSYTAPYSMDLQRTTVLYLTTDLVGGAGQRLDLGILHTIPCGVESNRQLAYQNNTVSATLMRVAPGMSQANFKVLDDNLNLIDLHGNQVIFTLIFYKKKDSETVFLLKELLIAIDGLREAVMSRGGDGNAGAKADAIVVREADPFDGFEDPMRADGGELLKAFERLRLGRESPEG